MWKYRDFLIRAGLRIVIPCLIGSSSVFLANSDHNDIQSFVINAGVGALFGLLIAAPSILIYYYYGEYDGRKD